MGSELFSGSAALWNRDHFDLRSDEMLAQVLDRGSLQDWRQVYRLAQADLALRGRIAHLVQTVPMATGWFWLAALAAMGEVVRWRVAQGGD